MRFCVFFFGFGCGSTEALKVYNSSPIVNITSHSEGVILEEGVEYICVANASDPNHSASELSIEWLLSGRIICSIENLGASAESTCSILPQEGDSEIRVVVSDPLQATGDDAISFVLEENQPPNISWISEEGTYQSNEALVFSAQLSDDRTHSSDLIVEWQSSAGTVTAYDTIDSQGIITSILTLPLGEQILQLFATDEEGKQSSASLFVEIQEGSIPPTLSWIAPTPGSLENEGNHTLHVHVQDSEDGLSGLAVSFSSDLDGALGNISSDGQGYATLNVSLSSGVHILSAMVTDSSHVTTTEILEFTVNDLPGAPDISFSPSAPKTGDDITALGSNSTDQEGDPLSYSFLWTLGTTQWTQQTLPSSMTQKGENWSVEITPNDGMGDGDNNSSSVTIYNTAPSIISGSILPSIPTVGDTLTTQVLGNDEDGDSITYDYDWSVNGTSVSTLDHMSGLFSTGDSVMVQLTPSDGSAFGTTVQLGPIVIANSPPTQPSISITPAIPTEATDDLICNIDAPSFDADGDAIQYLFSWTVNGSSYTSATTTYEQSDTVPASDIIAGEDWTCTVTPSDGVDSGTPDSVMVTVQADDGCPLGFTLAFDITDDASNQITDDCTWLWTNLFSLGTQFSFEWWGNNQHYGPSTWDLSSTIISIDQSYQGCSGSNYNLPSNDGLYFMTLVQYNDLLHIHPYNDPAEDGTDFYYGRIQATHTQDDEIYAVGYNDWTTAWQNRYETGDRFLACYQ